MIKRKTWLNIIYIYIYIYNFKPLNTYIINGIPNEMICYVGEETIRILLENPKSDFLFYFYNILEKKHIFSKNFTDHRKRLNEYRKKIK